MLANVPPHDRRMIHGALVAAFEKTWQPVTAEHLREHGFDWDGHVEECLECLVAMGEAIPVGNGYAPAPNSEYGE